MNAVTAVEWPITFEFSEDSRYNTLLQISVGQEEVDEVIGRDINRTFPEHPQFGFEQGQQALYRVLKAYSLHDLEVGYCQVELLPKLTYTLVVHALSIVDTVPCLFTHEMSLS